MKKRRYTFAIVAITAGLLFFALPTGAKMIELSCDELEEITGQGWIAPGFNSEDMDWMKEHGEKRDSDDRDWEHKKPKPFSDMNEFLANTLVETMEKSIETMNLASNNGLNMTAQVQNINALNLVAPAAMNPLSVVPALGIIPVPIFSSLLGIGFSSYSSNVEVNVTGSMEFSFH